MLDRGWFTENREPWLVVPPQVDESTPYRVVAVLYNGGYKAWIGDYVNEYKAYRLMQLASTNGFVARSNNINTLYPAHVISAVHYTDMTGGEIDSAKIRIN